MTPTPLDPRLAATSLAGWLDDLVSRLPYNQQGPTCDVDRVVAEPTAPAVAA